MSNTNPYQAAAERLMPLLYERIINDVTDSILQQQDTCVELIRSAIAAEVDAERREIGLDLDRLCHSGAAARVRSRIAAPSALEAMIDQARQAELDKIDAAQDALFIERGLVTIIRAERDRAIEERTRLIAEADELRTKMEALRASRELLLGCDWDYLLDKVLHQDRTPILILGWLMLNGYDFEGWFCQKWNEKIGRAREEIALQESSNHE